MRVRLWRRLNIRFVLIASSAVLIALADVALLAVSVPRFFAAPAVDWEALVDGGWRISHGLTPYENIGSGGGFVWSPVAAWLMVPLSVLGLWGWRLLHLVAALAMPTRTLRLAALLWWAFWIDGAFGNVTTFALLLGAWGLVGSRRAQLAFIALACLAPKPIFLPLVLWILLSSPALRRPAAGIIVANAALIALAGYGPDWLLVLYHRGAELPNLTNMSPSQVIGGWWLPVGTLLALWLYRRRLFGLAGLALSPYWFPYYFLMPLIDVERLCGSMSTCGRSSTRLQGHQ